VLFDVHKHGVLVPAEQLTVYLVNQLGDEQTKEDCNVPKEKNTVGWLKISG